MPATLAAPSASHALSRPATALPAFHLRTIWSVLAAWTAALKMLYLTTGLPTAPSVVIHVGRVKAALRVVLLVCRKGFLSITTRAHAMSSVHQAGRS